MRGVTTPPEIAHVKASSGDMLVGFTLDLFNKTTYPEVGLGAVGM